ncbi:MAG: arginine--tRNA ligase [Granulosicoccaceae bacterium]
MKAHLEQLLAEALAVLKANGVVPDDVNPVITVSRTRDATHGDYASNLAMILAKPAGRAPREIARAILDAAPLPSDISKAELAGPGFINFFAADDAQASVVGKVLSAKEQFGLSDAGKGQRWQVEFVSANPTGPLHVGHGRGAALGATISNLLTAVGVEVEREYYVNDAGRQMDILAASVWLRCLEAHGHKLVFPSNGYQGGYIADIASKLVAEQGDGLLRPIDDVFKDVPADEPAGGDKERHIDGLIANTKSLLGDNSYRTVFDEAVNTVLDGIKHDLEEFRVIYDSWFSEASIAGDVASCIDKLNAAGHIYEQDGAKVFRSSAFGDEKDRVVVRSNGLTTYFASDIAYINNKIERGYDKVLYLFGADHHGYTERMHAACEALGHPREKLEFLLIQFANLYRDGERVQMSTRSGSFVTIRELFEEIGVDAARYFYVMRRYQQHLDFDLDLAKSQSKNNPVYYVQYAHARICSMQRELGHKKLVVDTIAGLASLELLDTPQEAELLTLLNQYPEVVEKAAFEHEPHQLTGYLRDLANGLHIYYGAHKVLVDDAALRNARFCLLLAVKQVLVNGLSLIDVSTPEVM